MAKYFAMMSIRVVCFVLMVAIQPYGWYTWVFALGAIFLPYIAVVIANVAAAPAATAVAPERALTAGGEGAAPTGPEPESRPTVVRLQESPRPDEGA